MGIFDFLFGKKKNTLEDLHQENQQYVAEHPTPKNDEDALMREASLALTSGNFQQAVEHYQQLANNFPQKKGLYLSQVGAAYYFLNDFNQAIDYYVQAKENGADDSMMDDNIWEACEAIYENSQDKAAIQKYLEHYPDGSYASAARKLLVG